MLVHFVSLEAALALGLVIIVCVTVGAHRVSAAEAEWTRPKVLPASDAPVGGARRTTAVAPTAGRLPEGAAQWITDQQLHRLITDGWVERSRERAPDEDQVVITLWHPAQPIGDGDGRQVAVTMQRIMPLAPSAQLSLFSA